MEDRPRLRRTQRLDIAALTLGNGGDDWADLDDLDVRAVLHARRTGLLLHKDLRELFTAYIRKAAFDLGREFSAEMAKWCEMKLAAGAR